MRKLNSFLKEFIYPPNLLITLYFFLVWLIWGYLGWQEAIVNSGTWYFDLVGHAQFGFVLGGFVLAYLLRRYVPVVYYAPPKWIVDLIIVGLVIILQALVWEGYEKYFLDGYVKSANPKRPLAQTGDFDTTSDNWITTVGALLGITVRRLRRLRWEKKHPSEARAERIQEINARNNLLVADMLLEEKQIRRQWWRDLKRKTKQRVFKTLPHRHQT